MRTMLPLSSVSRKRAVEPPELPRSEVLSLAARANVDPRTVLNELAAQRGEREPVKGEAGRRVREVLAERGRG